MAWAEPIKRKGKVVGYRGRYRDAEGTVQDYKENGRIKVFARKTDAKAIATEEEINARRKVSETDSATPALANMTWGELWDRLVEPKRQFATSDRAETEANIVKNYLRPKWGDVPINRIVFKDEARGVYEWVEDLKSGKAVGWTLDRPPAATYVIGVYSVFSTSIRVAMNEGILGASPCAAVNNLPKRPKREKPYIAAASVEKLAEKNLREDYRDATDYMLETGLRPGELCGLHDEMIYDTGWMLVRHVLLKKKCVIRPWPKDLDERWVPLTERAIDIHGRRMEGRERSGGCGVAHTDDAVCDSVLVFRTLRGRPMRQNGLNLALKTAATRAGLPRGAFSGYGGRRGFATAAANGGLDPFALAAILGHATLEEVMGYVQRTPAARQRLLEALGARPFGMPAPLGLPPQLTVLTGGAAGAAVGADREELSVTQDQSASAGSPR